MSLGELAIKSVLENSLLHLHTALPGRVEKYSYKKQKASVKPLIKAKFPDGKILELPVITNVPVSFTRSGQASLTFPVSKGDTGLLIFAERSLDVWLSKGGDVLPLDSRKFDLSDAIFFPGLFPFTENSYADNNEDVLLKYKDAEIRIESDGSIRIKSDNSEIVLKNGKIELKNNQEELLKLIDEFMQAVITSFVPTVGGPQVLSNVPSMTAIKTRLQSLLSGVV